MSTWIILSWVFVILLSGINLFIFFKLKQTLTQMVSSLFPGTKDIFGALKKMEALVGGGGFGRGFGAQGPSKGAGSEAQLKAAMNMLQNMQRGNPRKKR